MSKYLEIRSCDDLYCKNCVHRKVCCYKDEFLSIAQAIANTNIFTKAENGEYSWRSILEVEYIDIDATCINYIYDSTSDLDIQYPYLDS